MITNVYQVKQLFHVVMLASALLPNVGFGVFGLFDTLVVLHFIAWLFKGNFQIWHALLILFYSVLLLANYWISADLGISSIVFFRTFVSLILVFTFLSRSYVISVGENVILYLWFALLLVNLSSVDFLSQSRTNLEIRYFNDLNMFLFSFLTLTFAFFDLKFRVICCSIILVLSLIFEARTALLGSSLALFYSLLKLPGYSRYFLLSALITIAAFSSSIIFSVDWTRGFQLDGYSRLSIWVAYLGNFNHILPSYNIALSLYEIGTNSFRPAHNSLLSSFFLFGHFGLPLAIYVLLSLARLSRDLSFALLVFGIFVFFDLFIAKELLYCLFFVVLVTRSRTISSVPQEATS